MVVAAVVAVVVAYAAGTFPTASIVGRRAGFDPGEGSGNPGASNSLRLGGRRAGALVLAGDALKGVLPAAAGLAAGGRAVALLLGAAAVVGHVYPATRRFHGGKGVATAAGVLAVVEPAAALAGAVVWGLALAATRTASVASLAGVAAALAAIVLLGRGAGEVAGFAALAVLIALRHRGNLARLRAGTEQTIEAPR